MPVAVNAARALGDERNRIKAAPASGDWAFFRVTRRHRMTPPVQRAWSRSRPWASSQPRSQDSAATEPPVLGIVPVAAGTGFFGVEGSTPCHSGRVNGCCLIELAPRMLRRTDLRMGFQKMV